MRGTMPPPPSHDVFGFVVCRVTLRAALPYFTKSKRLLTTHLAIGLFTYTVVIIETSNLNSSTTVMW